MNYHPRIARIAGGPIMIETIIFLALVVGVGAIVVKLFEWRQDVLYGPYIGRDDRQHR